MPYIKPSPERDELAKIADTVVDMLSGRTTGEQAGMMNFFNATVIKRLFERAPSYARLNALLGSLIDCRDELNRRITAPYEDKKRLENGDI